MKANSKLIGYALLLVLVLLSIVIALLIRNKGNDESSIPLEWPGKKVASGEVWQGTAPDAWQQCNATGVNNTKLNNCFYPVAYQVDAESDILNCSAEIGVIEYYEYATVICEGTRYLYNKSSGTYTTGGTTNMLTNTAENRVQLGDFNEYYINDVTGGTASRAWISTWPVFQQENDTWHKSMKYYTFWRGELATGETGYAGEYSPGGTVSLYLDRYWIPGNKDRVMAGFADRISGARPFQYGIFTSADIQGVTQDDSFPSTQCAAADSTASTCLNTFLPITQISTCVSGTFGQCDETYDTLCATTTSGLYTIYQCTAVLVHTDNVSSYSTMAFEIL